MNFLTEKRLILASKGLLFLLLLLPLFLSRSFYFPFIVPRYLIFYALVELLLLVYIYLLILNPSRYKLRLDKITCLVSGFFLVYLISAIVGVDRITSFWGIFERMDGVVSQAHWLVLFLIVYSLQFSWEEWQKFFVWEVWSSVIFIFYSIGQYFAWSGFFDPSNDRVPTTLGNPAYGAFYGFWMLALSVYFAVQSKKLWQKIAFGLLGLGNLWVLAATGTRGAFVGLVVAFIIGVILYVWKSVASRLVKRWFIVCLLGLLVLGGILWTQRQAAWLDNYPVLQRLVDISPQAQTAKTRLWAWDIAWQGFLARPAFGWGPETFLSPFAKYFNPQYFQSPASEVWFDHAHNNFLDLLVSIGIFGLAIYLTLAVLIILSLRRWLRIESRRWLAIILSAWFLGHLVESFFLFDHFSSYLIWFLLLAFIGGINVIDSNKSSNQSVKDNKHKTSHHQIYLIEGLLIAGLIAVFFYQFVVVAWQTNQDLLNALRYYSAGYFQVGTDWYTQAKNKGLYRLGDSEIIKKVAAAVVDYKMANAKGLTEDQIKELKASMDILLPDFQDLIKRHASDPQNYWMLGRVYNALFEIIRDDQYLPKAKEILAKGLELFPRRVDFWYEIAQTQMYQKNYLEAEQSFNRVKELNPGLVDVHWYLGITKLGQDQYQAAASEFNEAISRGFVYQDSSTKVRILLNLLLKLKDWPKIIQQQDTVLSVIAQERGNEDVYLLLALAHKRLGDEVNGKEILRKLANFNPSYQDVDSIWTQLRE